MSAKCPHCGGISGKISKIIFAAERVYYWDAELEGGLQDTDAYRVVRETIPKCMDCGKRVREIPTAIDKARGG